MTIGEIHLTKNYARYRIIDPEEFIKGSFKTMDVGRKGHTKIIRGRLKENGRWATQAILINKEDYLAGVRVVFKNGRPHININEI